MRRHSRCCGERIIETQIGKNTVACPHLRLERRRTSQWGGWNNRARACCLIGIHESQADIAIYVQAGRQTRLQAGRESPEKTLTSRCIIFFEPVKAGGVYPRGNRRKIVDRKSVV